MYSKLKMGDLLHRSKGMVEHAGVYLGNTQVLHNQPGKGVNITSYSEYSEGKEVKVTRTDETNTQLLKMRIKEIVGNNSRYKLLENNCEHVANYLITGRKFSPQIQATMAGVLIGAFAHSQFNRGHFLLWIIGGGAMGLMLSTLMNKYDFCLSPTTY